MAVGVGQAAMTAPHEAPEAPRPQMRIENSPEAYADAPEFPLSLSERGARYGPSFDPNDFDIVSSSIPPHVLGSVSFGSGGFFGSGPGDDDGFGSGGPGMPLECPPMERGPAVGAGFGSGPVGPQDQQVPGMIYRAC